MYSIALALQEIKPVFGCETERIPKGLLFESGIIHPRDVSLDVTLAEKILKTKMRSVEEVGKWRQAESMSIRYFVCRHGNSKEAILYSRQF